MSRTYRKGAIRNPNIRRKRSYRKLGRAVIYLVNAQQEQEAISQYSRHIPQTPRRIQNIEKIRL